MLIKSYNSFLDNYKINENVQFAKIWLRQRAIDKEKKLKPNLDIKPSDLDNIEATALSNRKFDVRTAVKIKSQADENSNYLVIKEMLKNNSNLTYAFVRFSEELGIPLHELQETYNRLLELKKSGLSWTITDKDGNRKPMNFDAYANIGLVKRVRGADTRNGFERLCDDITKLETERSVDRFIRNLPGEFIVKNRNAPDYGTKVLSFRDAAKMSTGQQREEIEQIAVGFDEIGKDLKERERLHKLFYVSCYRYRSLRDVLQAAQEYLSSCNNRSAVDLLVQIDEVNSIYGLNNGAEVVYNANDIIIFEVKSFQANKVINASTKHCIKDSYSHWQTYVSEEGLYNKQYYIWNFNQNPTSREFIIGVTVESDGDVSAAHYKDDDEVKNIKQYFKTKLGLEFDKICIPMTTEEVEMKKNRDEANKRIIIPTIDYDKLTQYLEYGADPNAKEGLPLINAVRRDNYQSAELLIKKGARTSIGSPIKFAKSDEMIMLLLKNGADPSGIDFLTHNRLKMFLENGMDPNNNNGKPILRAISLDSIDSIELLLNYGALINIKGYTSLHLAISMGRWKIVQILLGHLIATNQKIPPQDLKLLNKSFNESVKSEKSSRNKTLINELKETLKSFAK